MTDEPKLPTPAALHAKLRRRGPGRKGGRRGKSPGRPKLEEPRVRLTVRVKEATRVKLGEMSGGPRKIGRTIDRLVEDA